MRRDGLTIKVQAALLVTLLAAGGISTRAWAQELSVSAKVDRTTVDVATPLQLTVTVSGDLTGLEVQPLEFPDGFSVASRSQATNFSIRGGIQERSMSLLFVLVPSKAGTFQLGPFQFTQGQRELQTQPIEVIVQKSALPPKLPSNTERYTL